MEKKPEDASSQVTPSRSPRSVKKPYVKPALTEYGSVAKLTRAGSGSRNDGGGGGMMRMCL